MQKYYYEVISGEAVGCVPATLRAALLAVSTGYRAAAAVRNFAYDHGWKQISRLSAPVISVGNLTTGGTGKTPTVIMIARQLRAMGAMPAVLTRGYMAAAGQESDEVLVMRHECPDVPVVVNADRVVGGQVAIKQHGADILIMDDGFQHRRLARSMNLVVVDATRPLGVPGVIPRGTWREPPASLSRATHVMLTRCEQIPQDLADLAAQLLSQYVGPRHILQQRTRITGVFDASGKRWELCGKRALAFAGIGNPDNFLSTLELAGCRPVAGCWFGDHHRYDFKRDFAAMEAITTRRGIDIWVTTLKDFVKLRGYQPPVPLVYVAIESYISGSQTQVWRDMLRAVVAADGAAASSVTDVKGSC